jgi:hypothetical protein
MFADYLLAELMVVARVVMLSKVATVIWKHSLASLKTYKKYANSTHI